MKKYNYRASIKTVFNMIVFLTVFFLTQAGQASGESRQGKKVDCDYEELLRIVNISNDRIEVLEREQSKIPRLVKSAIDNIFATVMERKVKGLESELKAEFGAQLGTLEADVSERIKLIEENSGEALTNLSESLKDEIIIQLLARDMKIAASLSELKQALKISDKGVTALHAASNDNYLNGEEIVTVLKSEEPPVYGYQESPQEESKKNLLLISQMFGYIDEKDREIASLSERLKSLEAFAVESMSPIRASRNRMME